MKNSFQRKEIKFLLNNDQKEMLLHALSDQLEEDEFAHYFVSSIYYDSPGQTLLKEAANKDEYRERVRVRSYQENPGENDLVYAEVKKKVKKLGMKEREAITYKELDGFLENAKGEHRLCHEMRRIQTRIRLEPPFFLGYERWCWHWKEDPQLRITIDKNIVCRKDEIQFCKDPARDISLLDEKMCILEIKSLSNLPLRLARVLSVLKIRQTSFSKASKAMEVLEEKERSSSLRGKKRDLCPADENLESFQTDRKPPHRKSAGLSGTVECFVQGMRGV